MASKSSMAIRQDAAMQRMKQAIRVIWGEDFELPYQFRDPAMLIVLQWEAIADYLDCKAQGAVIPVAIDLDTLPETTTVALPVQAKAKAPRKPKAKTS